MILFVLSVRDTAADCFGQPMFTPSLGGAVRSFGDEVNRKSENNALANHPEDFILYQLGTFDDSTGKFELMEEPRQLTRGKDHVR